MHITIRLPGCDMQFFTSIASEFCDKVCHYCMPLFFICWSLYWIDCGKIFGIFFFFQKCPFWSISVTALISYIRPCNYAEILRLTFLAQVRWILCNFKRFTLKWKYFKLLHTPNCSQVKYSMMLHFLIMCPLRRTILNV